MAPRIVCVAGKKKCGKTTFLEKLIAALGRRGMRAAVVKHDRHGFQMDQPGKDTFRLKQAGAVAAAICSPDQVGLVRDVAAEPTLSQVAEMYFSDVDIVLAEGYSSSHHPKIEVFRPEAHDSLLCEVQHGLVAVVTDAADVDPGVPVFGLDDGDGVAEFIL
ncbi:MAG: molybdopterin-guanine dinucleotide biosynthesis protein B, partial [Desulfovibrionaceae bacterium]